MIQMLLNPEGIPALSKQQYAEIALTADDKHLEQYANMIVQEGKPARFFSGKVSMQKDIIAGAPSSPSRSVNASAISQAPKSPAALSSSNLAFRQQQ